MARQVRIRGTAELELLEDLAPDTWREIPTGRDGIAGRALVFRLARKGALELDEAEERYRRAGDVDILVQRPILEHLRAGPVSSADWHRYCASPKSLHVQISRLRDSGFNITSRPAARARRVGRPAVIYELED